MVLTQTLPLFMDKNSDLFRAVVKKSYIKIDLTLFSRLIKKFEKISPKEEYRVPDRMIEFENIFHQNLREIRGTKINKYLMHSVYISIFQSISNLSREIEYLLEEMSINEKNIKTIEVVNKLAFAYSILASISAKAVYDLSESRVFEEKEYNLINRHIRCVMLIVIRLHEIYTDLKEKGKAECFDHLEWEIETVEQYLDIRYKQVDLSAELFLVATK